MKLSYQLSLGYGDISKRVGLLEKLVKQPSCQRRSSSLPCPKRGALRLGIACLCHDTLDQNLTEVKQSGFIRYPSVSVALTWAS